MRFQRWPHWLKVATWITIIPLAIGGIGLLAGWSPMVPNFDGSEWLLAGTPTAFIYFWELIRPEHPTPEEIRLFYFKSIGTSAVLWFALGSVIGVISNTIKKKKK